MIQAFALHLSMWLLWPPTLHRPPQTKALQGIIRDCYRTHESLLGLDPQHQRGEACILGWPMVVVKKKTKSTVGPKL